MSSETPPPAGTVEGASSSTTEGPPDQPKPTDTVIVAGDPGVRRVPVGRDHFAVVDVADYDLVSGYRWCLSRGATGKLYAVAHQPLPGGGRTTVGMHRLIAATPAGLMTDHRDGDGLNNRRSNLRSATRAENAANSGARSGRRYKGVYREGPKRWSVEIRAHGVRINLGRFSDEADAARAYDAAAVEHYGEFARLNFPDEAGRTAPARTTQSQVLAAQGKVRGGTSRHKGVSYRGGRGRWTARIYVNRTYRFLGSFADEDAAGRAYDAAALEAWGEFAHLNFPAEVSP